MSDAERLYAKLDDLATEYDCYSLGLPHLHEVKAEGIAIIDAAIAQARQSAFEEAAKEIEPTEIADGGGECTCDICRERRGFAGMFREKAKGVTG
jgi:hypothetical protein